MRRTMNRVRYRRVVGPPLVTLLLCCPLLVFPAPARGAAAGGAGGEIIPGKGVGEIYVGMAAADLLRLWGPPERTDRDTDGVVLYDYGEKKGVGIFLSGDRIAQILVVTSDWSTPNGIKVGATRPEVVAFYGRPDEALQGPSPDEMRYWYRQRGLVFIFKNRAVAGITVIAAETPEAPKGLDPNDPARRKPFLPTPGAPPGSRY